MRHNERRSTTGRVALTLRHARSRQTPRIALAGPARAPHGLREMNVVPNKPPVRRKPHRSLADWLVITVTLG